MKTRQLVNIDSLAALCDLCGLPKPAHAHVALIDVKRVKSTMDMSKVKFSLPFYVIVLEENVSTDSRILYGQKTYDFNQGTLAFLEPGQVFALEQATLDNMTGWWLVFHPEYLFGYPLATQIHQYNFFSYSVNEALHLSHGELQSIYAIFELIIREYEMIHDDFSHDVIISQLGLLLHYSNRFYHRQFATRQPQGNDYLLRFETLLDCYFNESLEHSGVPTVQEISQRMNLSANYLSDMLRELTGLSTQQHIHQRLIERAKNLLSTTDLSVYTIAYQLGFEHPQSFCRLFKNKTNFTPISYRKLSQTSST